MLWRRDVVMMWEVRRRSLWTNSTSMLNCKHWQRIPSVVCCVWGLEPHWNRLALFTHVHKIQICCAHGKSSLCMSSSLAEYLTRKFNILIQCTIYRAEATKQLFHNDVTWFRYIKIASSRVISTELFNTYIHACANLKGWIALLAIIFTVVKSRQKTASCINVQAR